MNAAHQSFVGGINNSIAVLVIAKPPPRAIRCGTPPGGMAAIWATRGLPVQSSPKSGRNPVNCSNQPDTEKRPAVSVTTGAPTSLRDVPDAKR